MGDVVNYYDFETDSEDESILSYRCRCNGKFYVEREEDSSIETQG